MIALICEFVYAIAIHFVQFSIGQIRIEIVWIAIGVEGSVERFSNYSKNNNVSSSKAGNYSMVCFVMFCCVEH